MKSDSGIAGDDALGGRLADALLDAGEEALRARSRRRPSRRTRRRRRGSARARARRRRTSRGRRSASCSGRGPGSCRGSSRLYGTLRRVGHDRRAELALEPLDDHRDVGLAHRPQDLLAGRRSARRATVGSSSSIRWRAGPILSRSALVCGSMATASDGLREVERRQRSAASRATTACRRSRSRSSLATAPISPALSSPIGSCSLPWRSSSWPIRSSSPRVAFQTWAWEWSVPRQHAQVGQPADERVGGRS